MLLRLSSSSSGKAYNASKSAVVRLTQTMAYEFAYSVDAKIRVNSVGE